MKKQTIAAYLGVPALIAAGIFAYGLFTRESFGVESLISFAGGYLFYAAPFFLWAIIATLGKFTNKVCHAGFMAASIALVAIACFWFFPGDPSGLPLQWMLYWPLAIVLQIVSISLTVIFIRVKL